MILPRHLLVNHEYLMEEQKDIFVLAHSLLMGNLTSTFAQFLDASFDNLE